MAVTPFVLICKQRSGSSWLADTLNSNPSIKMFGEIFLWRKRQWGIRMEEFPGYYDYASSARFAIRPWSIYKYLDLFFTQSNEAVGFKLMYSQIKQFPDILFYLHSRKIRVLHLIRHNYLDTIISLENARAQQQWHSGSIKGTPKATSAIHLDPETTIHRIVQLERQIKLMEAIFRRVGINSCQIFYEDLLTNPTSSYTKLHRFLDLEYQNIHLQSSLKKLVMSSHQETISNYEEFKIALSKTRYAALLE
jgi:LPS sulfotransferase NodH